MLMIEKRAGADPGMVVVTFTVNDLGHELPVALVGDFNDWDADATLLESVGEGRLTVSLTLATERRYAFRYRDARGRWFNDDAADDYSDNEWGGVNAVVVT